MKMTGMEVAGGNAASRLERLPVCGYHRMLFVVIALAFFFDNVDLATMTFVLGSIKSEFGLSSAQAGMLGSASFAGMALGALCSGAWFWCAITSFVRCVICARQRAITL